MTTIRTQATRALLLTTSVLALATGGAAMAGPLPTGGALVGGSAAITSPSATQVTVTQAGGRAIINWSGFSIGAGNTVQFNNGSGATLNRVTGAAGSQIDGTLSATGSVYLINPNGVVIGKSGVVSVGGTFAASTLDIANAAFMAGGDLTFSGPSTASVINLGRIGASGGDVALIAQTVENDGTITAANGDAGLLAGSQVTLLDTLQDSGKFQVALGSATSSTNAGQIQAAVAELRAYGGNVYALAGNSGGSIIAMGTATKDGQVFLTANAAIGSTGVGDVTISAPVSFSGGANALTIDAFHNANILTPISTSGGHVTLTANDGGVGGDYSFGLSSSFAGILSFTGGAGSGESLTIDGLSYTLIYSLADLSNVNSDPTGAYALANNLDARTRSYTQSPITSGNFSGEFDGLGHTITGLTIDAPTMLGVGLISHLTGELSHIGLVGEAIIGSEDVGGLVGDSQGARIVQVYSTGSVFGSTSGAGFEGGLVGAPADSSIEGSYSTAAVTGASWVGGLVGEAFGTTIEQSYATGAVSGINQIGGLAGEFLGDYASGRTGGVEHAGVLSQTYATGSVTGTGNNVGGLIGLSSLNVAVSQSYAAGAVSGGNEVGGLIGDNAAGSTVTNSYATGSVNGEDSVGKLVGLNEASDDIFSFDDAAVISNTYASGAVRGQSHSGGLVGVNAGTVSTSYWDIDYPGQQTSDVGTGLTFRQFTDPQYFTGFIFTTTPGGSGWVIVDQDGSLNKGNGATRPMLAWEYSTSIANGHQLQLIAMNLNASYTLANDIELSGNNSGIWNTIEGFSPIGNFGSGYNYFTGRFNGQGHTIDGLAIATDATTGGGNSESQGIFLEHGGLFGVVGGGAVIENLHLTNVSVEGDTNIGGLVGRVLFGPVTITNVSVSGNVLGNTTVGGLVGYSSGADVFTNDSFSGNVRGTYNIGGLIGYETGATITGSSASGQVNGDAPVGGLIGWAALGVLSDNTASTYVNGEVSVGGLVGYDQAATIDGSSASGMVSVHVSSYSGPTYGGLAGGLVGDDQGGAISRSFATGDIETSLNSGMSVGGLVGRALSANLSDDYASGSVNTLSDDNTEGYGVGGLVGRTDAATTITRSYAIGLIIGHVEGGLVGENYGAISDAYWNIQTTGLSNAVGAGSGSVSAAGLTTAQMGLQASYVGWDFTATWNPAAAGAPPTLRP